MRVQIGETETRHSVYTRRDRGLLRGTVYSITPLAAFVALPRMCESIIIILRAHANEDGEIKGTRLAGRTIDFAPVKAPCIVRVY